MTTYKIVGKTNPWIAQRDSDFNGKTEIIIKRGLTIREARRILLDYFCTDHDCYFPNWGVAMNSKIGRDYASRRADGTYSYEWDSRYYSIEEEESWTYSYIVELNGQPVESGEVTFHDEDDEEEFIERMTAKYEDELDDCVEVMFR